MTTITCTLADLVRADGVLPQVLAPVLPAKAHYHVAKLVRLMRPEVQHYHDAREALIKELGAERDATAAETATPGRIWAVLPEHQAAFATRLQELGALEVTIPWSPIPIDSLPDLTGADLEALLPLIADPEHDDVSDAT